LKRGFVDVGYHYLVRRSGIIELGRGVWQRGAHCRGHNHDSIGIALVGHTVFHEEQFNSCAKLCFDLQMQFGKLEIEPHNKYSNKQCPVFNVNIIKGLTHELETICSSYME